MSVPSYDSASNPKLVRNYHVVVITRLPHFKLPEHSEADVVQFMVRLPCATLKQIMFSVCIRSQLVCLSDRLLICIHHQGSGKVHSTSVCVFHSLMYVGQFPTSLSPPACLFCFLSLLQPLCRSLETMTALNGSREMLWKHSPT